MGVLTDEVIVSYKRYPLIPLRERIEMFSSLRCVSKVVVQDSLEYDAILQELRPDIVISGDNWTTSYQAEIRERVIAQLKQWGGELIEFPYTHTPTEDIITQLDKVLAMPENRRSRLKKLLSYKPVYL